MSRSAENVKNEEVQNSNQESTSDLIRKVSRQNLEELDKTLDELHELAEDVYLRTSLASNLENFFEENGQVLRKCETIPHDLMNQPTSEAEEEGLQDEVVEAVRDAEEKQFDAHHVSMNVDTECSSEDESAHVTLPPPSRGRRMFDEFCRSEQEMSFNPNDNELLSLRNSGSSNRRVRQRRISSNAALNEMTSMVSHERARSNDSRSTSLFSSSIASFRRPVSHFSIDNSCFELNDAPYQHSLMCTPIEKMYVKNSRSAPEMRIHDTTKINQFLSTPSPSNDATASEPSVSSEISMDQSSSSPPIVNNLKLRLNEGLTEIPSPMASPIVRQKTKKQERSESKSRLKSSTSSPNMKIVVNEIPNIVVKPKKDENRSVEVININMKQLNLSRDLRKPLTILAKLDTTDVYRSPKLTPSSALTHEFSVETTESFSKLHLVFVEGSKARVARPVGKVTLLRRNLANMKNADHSLSLSAVSKYLDFCGQICIDVRRRPGLFSIRVVDCGGLKIKENPQLLLLVSTIGTSKFQNVGKLAIDVDEKRSKEWLEMPCSEGMLSLKLTLWQDLLKGINSVFHGQVRVDIDENWETGPAKWFYLRSKSKEPSTSQEESEKIGEVVLRTNHQIDHILRMQVYKPLLDLLTLPNDDEPGTASLVALIESLPKVELGQTSRSLVELLMAQSDTIRPVLNSLYNNSILKCQDENTLFRGQSLAGKILFEILTSFGKMYLITTLKPVIDKIYKERKNCEIDPVRTTTSQSVEKNKSNLLVYFQMLFQVVTQSSTNCPHFIKQLLFDLRSIVDKHTGRIEVQRLAVSSFIIMRFFAAAVLNPKAFEIRRDVPDMRVSRTLLLLSKLLQRVSNCTVSQGPLSTKESWLNDVFEMVSSEEHKQEMTEFLDNISLVGNAEPEKSSVFKFGNLQQIDRTKTTWKKVLPNKKRYCQLTETQFIWQKDVNGQPKGILKLEDVKSVTIDNKNVLTLISENDQVQFETRGGLEASEWACAIEKQRSKFMDICSSEPFVYDIERHCDKIHNLLHKYRETMTEWIDLLESNAEIDEKTTPEILSASFIPEQNRELHKTTLVKTMKKTIDITDTIQAARDEYEKQHKNQQRMEEGEADDE